MYQEQIEELKKDRKSPNDLALLEELLENFSKIPDTQVFTPFAVNSDPETVQPILDLLDPRLIAYPSEGMTVISM